VVAVEDVFVGTLRSDPPAPALDRLQNVYSATVRFHGGNPTIGPRLCALLSAGGLKDVREEMVVNPMQTIDEKLFLAQLVRNMRASIIRAGAATDAQIDEHEASVEQAARGTPHGSSIRPASARCRDGGRDRRGPPWALTSPRRALR